MRKLFFYFLLCINFISFSQSSRVDRAVTSLRYQPGVKIAEALNDSSFDARFIDPEIGLKFARAALPYAEKSGNKGVKGTSLFYIGTAFHIIGTYDSAMFYYQKAEKVFLDFKNIKSIGTTYLQIGLLFGDTKDNQNAIVYTEKALEYLLQAKDTANIAAAYSNIGVFYNDLQNNDSSSHYYLKALELHKKHMNVSPEDKALNLSICYTNVGSIYQKEKKYNEAIYYFKLAATEDEKHNDFLYKINTYENLASCYNYMDESRKAIQLSLNAIKLLDKTRGYRSKENIYNILADGYKRVKQYDSAYYYLKEYTILVDSIYNLENQKVVSDMQQKYDNDKKLSEIELLNKDKQAADTFRKTLYIIIVLILVVVLVLIYSYILKQRSNKNLVLKNEEINDQKNVIEKQKHLVEEKQKEIIDSIRYAKRIQQSLMPTSKYIAKKLKDLSK